MKENIKEGRGGCLISRPAGLYKTAYQADRLFVSE